MSPGATQSHPDAPATNGGTHILEGPPGPSCPRATQSPPRCSSSHQWNPHLWGTPKAILSPGHTVPGPPSPCPDAAPMGGSHILGDPRGHPIPRTTQSLPRCSCSCQCYLHIWRTPPRCSTSHWRCPSGGHPGPPTPHRVAAAPTGGTHILWDPRATPLLPERLRAVGAVATGWHCGTVPELSPGLTRGRSPASCQPHAAPRAEPPDPLLCPDGGPRHAARHRHHAHRCPLLLPRVSPGDGDMGAASCLVPPELR